MKNTLSIIFFFISIYSWGCINEYRTLISGEVILTEPTSGKIWTKEIDKEELRKKANKLFEQYQHTGSIEYFSDYGASLIYLGEFEKAKKIYFEIENSNPNLYTTASNLGTLYELMGKTDSALFWIKKSVALNPDSHEGSEWIHIKILEFKIRNDKNPDASILDLDFGKGLMPGNPHNYDLHKLREHIWHQLRERVNFVKPKDKIVGSVYFDYGNVLAQTHDLEAALESYQAAREYGFENEIMDQRIEKFESLTRAARFKEKTMKFLKENFKAIFFSGLVFMILIVGYVFYRLVKRRNILKKEKA